MLQTAHRQTRRERLLRLKAGYDAGVGQQIAGNLYRGGGGRFAAGGGSLTPAQQRQNARGGERSAYGQAEDARRQAEDAAIDKEPDRHKRAALRRATILARRARIYARRAQRRQLDEQDQFARNQESQERQRATAERRAKRIAEVLARREAARQARAERNANKPAKAPKPKKPTAEETRAANRAHVRDQMATSDTGLSPSGVDNLLAFADGQSIPLDRSQSFVAMGLMEGEPPRLTVDGRQVVDGLNHGDYRKVVDNVNEAAGKRLTTERKQQNKADEIGFRAIEDRLLDKAPDGKARAALRRRFVKERRERKQRRDAGERVQPPKQRDVSISGKAHDGLIVYKDARGAYRWLAISSTAYRDRDGEIISTKALTGAVAKGDATGDRGVLRYWHVPGLDIGVCDYQATAHEGRLLIESGTFDRPDYAMALKARGRGWGVSPGFLHSPDQPDRYGVFHDITIFERSICPPGKASNLFTSITTKESRMTLTPDKDTQLAALLGGRESPAYKAALDKMAETEKTAQASGVTFKSADDEGLPLLTDASGAQYTVKEGRLIALKAAKPLTDPPEQFEAKAPMDPAAMIDAGATEQADGEAEEGLDDLLSDGDVNRVAQAVVALIQPLFDIHKQVGELKGALGGMAPQAQTTKEPDQNTIADLIAQYQASQQTVKQAQPSTADLQARIAQMEQTIKTLQGDQPLAAGSRATQSAETIVAATDPLMSGYKSVTDNPDGIVASFMNGFRQPNG